MELSCSNIKKLLIFSQRKAFLIFCQKKAFVIFQETETSKKKSSYFGKRKPRKNSLYFRIRNFLIFEETETRKTSYITFLARKLKNPLWKNFSYFGKSNFIVLKNLIKLPYEKLDA